MIIPVAFLFFYACKKDNGSTTPTPTVSPVTQLTAALTGTSAGTGAFTGNVNKTTGVLNYTVTFSGLSAAAITLDPVSTSATSTTVGSILLAGNIPTATTPSTGTATSGTATTGVTLTSPQTGTRTLSTTDADAVSKGQYRINIRTAASPNGAIGGTVTPR